MARLLKNGFFIFCLLLLGCVTVDPQKDYQAANTLSQNRTGYPIIWQQSDDDRAQVKKMVDDLLSGGLTTEKAVRIALINNQDLQAKFEMLGIARADVVQSGLYRNPSLSGLFQFPLGSTAGSHSVDADVLLTLSDLWNVPIRRKIASYDAQKITLQIVSDIIKTAAQTRDAYNDYLLQFALEQLTRRNVQLYENQLKTTRQHYEAGLVNDMAIYMVKMALYNEKLGLARIKADCRSAYATLMKMIGLDPLTTNINIKGKLSITKPVKLSLTDAWRYALHHRIDLKIARLQIQQTQYILKLQKAMVFGDVGLGAGYTKELDKAKRLGPLVSFQLPLFNQNQAGIARAEYQLRKAKKMLSAKENRSKESILRLLNELKFQRIHAKLHQEKMISTREKALKYARHHAEAMKINQFILIEMQRGLLEAQRNYLIARHRYTQANIQLDMALGVSAVNKEWPVSSIRKSWGQRLPP